MCKFTYLGYAGCEEPERHYFIRREKCVGKAHLKHWCDPHEQEEVVLDEDELISDLACPMCADIPVIYDQPLLEIAHSRRSVLPAPHYDGVTGQYSRFPRHHGHNNNTNRMNRPPIPPKNSSEALVPRPLNMARKQMHQRSASETAINRIRQREVGPDYQLPSAKYEEDKEQEVLMLPSATYMPGGEQIPMLPATAYMPPPEGAKQQPKPLPMPQPMELTPPSSRDASMSPPQNRMGMMMMRTIPPGESSRRELESIRERAKLAAAKESRPATPQSRPGTDRSRSGSESSTSSFGNPNPPPPPPPPRRKASVASSEGSSSSSSSSNAPSSKSGSVTSRTARRPEHHRKESSASSASASSTSRTPPQEENKFTTAALRSIGIGIDRTASPERGRGRQRRERGGSSSERSDSPSVWRPTISPPQLQQDSLGMGSNTNIVEPLKQRLVPFRPTKSGATTPNSVASTPRREGSVEDRQRPKMVYPSAANNNSSSSNNNNNNNNNNKQPAVALRLYPNKKDDEKIATAAFNAMLHEEQKALYAAQKGEQKQVKFEGEGQARGEEDDVESAVEMQLPTVSMQFTSGGDPYGTAGVGRSKNLAAAARTGLRRIQTGQVKTVTIASPRPLKRANTSEAITPSSATMRIKGGPLFSIAGVGGKTQEFEIVSNNGDASLGQAF